MRGIQLHTLPARKAHAQKRQVDFALADFPAHHPTHHHTTVHLLCRNNSASSFQHRNVGKGTVSVHHHSVDGTCARKKKRSSTIDGVFSNLEQNASSLVGSLRQSLEGQGTRTSRRSSSHCTTLTTVRGTALLPFAYSS